MHCAVLRVLTQSSRAQVGRRYELPPELLQLPPSPEQTNDDWRAAVCAADADIEQGKCASWTRPRTVAYCLMAAFQAWPCRTCRSHPRPRRAACHGMSRAGG